MAKDKTKAFMKRMNQKKRDEQKKDIRQAFNTIKRNKNKGKINAPKPGSNPELIYLSAREVTESSLLTPAFTRESLNQKDLISIDSLKQQKITAVGLVTMVEPIDDNTVRILLERPQAAIITNSTATQEKTKPLSDDLWITISDETTSHIHDLYISIGDMLFFNARVRNTHTKENPVYSCTDIDIITSGFLHKEIDKITSLPVVTSDYPRHDTWLCHVVKDQPIIYKEPIDWVKDLLDQRDEMANTSLI